MRSVRKITAASTTILTTLPGMVFAKEAKLSTYEGTEIPGFLEMIRTWFLGFAGALAVLFIVIGGIKFITSSGNPKQLESAKKTLTYAIIGLLAVLLSTVILNLIAGDLVGSIFGGNGVATF